MTFLKTSTRTAATLLSAITLALLFSAAMYFHPALVSAEDDLGTDESAQDDSPGTDETGNGDDQTGNGGDQTGSGGDQTTNPGGSLDNPLESDTIPEFLLKIIDVILVFAIPLIILYIMYAGYLFVTAAGNTEQIGTAKNALLWAVVGGVIVIGARAIITVIEGTVSGL